MVVQNLQLQSQMVQVATSQLEQLQQMHQQITPRRKTASTSGQHAVCHFDVRSKGHFDVRSKGHFDVRSKGQRVRAPPSYIG